MVTAMTSIGPGQHKDTEQTAGRLAPPRTAKRPRRWFELLRLWWEGFD